MKEPLIMYGIDITSYAIKPLLAKVYNNSSDSMYLLMREMQPVLKNEFDNTVTLKFTQDKKVFIGVEAKFPWEPHLIEDKVEVAKIIYSFLSKYMEDLKYEQIVEDCKDIRTCIEV